MNLHPKTPTHLWIMYQSGLVIAKLPLNDWRLTNKDKYGIILVRDEAMPPESVTFNVTLSSDYGPAIFKLQNLLKDQRFVSLAIDDQCQGRGHLLPPDYIPSPDELEREDKARKEKYDKARADDVVREMTKSLREYHIAEGRFRTVDDLAKITEFFETAGWSVEKDVVNPLLLRVRKPKTFP